MAELEHNKPALEMNNKFLSRCLAMNWPERPCSFGGWPWPIGNTPQGLRQGQRTILLYPVFRSYNDVSISAMAHLLPLSYWGQT